MTGGANYGFYCMGRFSYFFRLFKWFCNLFAFLVAFSSVNLWAYPVEHFQFKPATDLSKISYRLISDYFENLDKLPVDFQVLVKYLYTTPVFNSTDNVPGQYLACGSSSSPLFMDLISMYPVASTFKRDIPVANSPKSAFISLLAADSEIATQRSTLKDTGLVPPPYDTAGVVVKQLYPTAVDYLHFIYRYFPPKALIINESFPIVAPKDKYYCHNKPFKYPGETESHFNSYVTSNDYSIFNPDMSCVSANGDNFQAICQSIATGLGGNIKGYYYPWDFGQTYSFCEVVAPDGTRAEFLGSPTSCSGCPASTACQVGFRGTNPISYCVPTATVADTELLSKGWGVPDYLLDSAQFFYKHPLTYEVLRYYDYSLLTHCFNGKTINCNNYVTYFRTNDAYGLDATNNRLYAGWLTHNISSEQYIYKDSATNNFVVQRDFKYKIIRAKTNALVTVTVRLVFYLGSESSTCVSKLLISYFTSDGFKLTASDVVPIDYYGTTNLFYTPPTSPDSSEPKISSVDFGVAPTVTVDSSIKEDWYKDSLSTPFLNVFKNWKLNLNIACNPLELTVSYPFFGVETYTTNFICVAMSAQNKFVNGFTNYGLMRLFFTVLFFFASLRTILDA